MLAPRYNLSRNSPGKLVFTMYAGIETCMSTFPGIKSKLFSVHCLSHSSNAPSHVFFPKGRTVSPVRSAYSEAYLIKKYNCSLLERSSFMRILLQTGTLSNCFAPTPPASLHSKNPLHPPPDKFRLPADAEGFLFIMSS